MSKEIKIQSMELLKSLGLIVIAVHGIKDGNCTCSNRKECQSPGKHPVKKHWKDNPIQSLNEINPLMIDREYVNLGVVTGNGLVVVDIDPKNGGIESFKMIEHLFNPTFTVVTGSGGYHFYYYLPSDYNKAVSNRVNVLNGIDVRGDGGFVVAPGSLHKSGNLYEIADDSLSAIQVIGTELLDLITKEKSYEHASPIQNNSELVDYFGEGERNHKMAAIAGNLFRQGLSIDGVRDSLLSINDSVCSPPLSGKEVESIVKSISKYKNNEQQDLSEDKLETPAGKVRALLHNSKLNANMKNELISNLIIEDLCLQGKFYNALGEYFYFHNENKKLVAIKLEDINYKGLLSRYGINASTTFHKYVYQSLIVHSESEGEDTQIFKYAHYNKKKNIVYLKCNEGMYKITSENVSYCDNGTDGVLFSDSIEVDPFEFIENLDEQDYINDYVISFGQYNDSYVCAETQKLLAKCYFIGLFMPEFLGTKPILVVKGERGSAKTSLLKAFVKCLYGDKYSVTSMPSKSEDLDILVVNSHFLALDNVDTAKTDLNDKLAVISTGGFVKRRKLYTDGQMYKAYLDSFIGISTRTLPFRRDDVLQRLLLLEFDIIKAGFKDEESIFNPILVNRDKILSQAIKKVQSILQIIHSKKYKNFKSGFRMADFAKLLTMFLNNHTTAEKHLYKLSSLQKFTTLENDILIPYLAKYVEDCCSLAPRRASAYDIYQVLEGYAALGAANTLFKNEFTQSYDKVVSFAKRLNNIRDDISEYIVIETVRGGGNQTLYVLSKGKKFDELPQKRIIDGI